MKNIVYVIVIFFWILSMISKAKRQKQQAAERERIKNLNKRAGQEVKPKKMASFSDDVPGVFSKEEGKESATNYESAYASTDYAENITERTVVRSEGLKSISLSTLGTESAEEKEAYDKDKQIIPSLSLTNAAIKQYVIAAEILGKPKALR